jgi:hypothetical protein
LEGRPTWSTLNKNRRGVAHRDFGWRSNPEFRVADSPRRRTPARLRPVDSGIHYLSLGGESICIGNATRRGYKTATSTSGTRTSDVWSLAYLQLYNHATLRDRRFALQPCTPKIRSSARLDGQTSEMGSSPLSLEEDSRTCGRCLQHFTHSKTERLAPLGAENVAYSGLESSLVRHAKRCYRNEKPLPRRKACQQCATSKARCDLGRPTCGRCQARSTTCEFAVGLKDGPRMLQHPAPEERQVSPVRSRRQPESFEYLSVENEWLYGSASASSSELSPAASLIHQTNVPTLSTTPEIDPPAGPDEGSGRPGVSFDRIFSESRHQSLLGESTPSGGEILTSRATHFMLRVLKSWPRMMAMHGPDLLPPLIHKLQLANGIPGPLANCYTLVNIWSAGADTNPDLVRDSIVQEIRRLLSEVHIPATYRWHPLTIAVPQI